MTPVQSLFAGTSIRQWIWWVAASFAASSLVLWFFNVTATADHPVTSVAAAFGILVYLLTIMAVYYALRYGVRHLATRYTSGLAITGFIGQTIRWLPIGTFFAIAVACGILVVMVRSAAGRRELLLLILTLPLSAVAYAGVMIGAGWIVKCDPRYRWLCEAESASLLCLLVIFELAACAYTRSAVSKQRAAVPTTH